MEFRNDKMTKWLLFACTARTQHSMYWSYSSQNSVYTYAVRARSTHLFHFIITCERSGRKKTSYSCLLASRHPIQVIFLLNCRRAPILFLFFLSLHSKRQCPFGVNTMRIKKYYFLCVIQWGDHLHIEFHRTQQSYLLLNVWKSIEFVFEITVAVAIPKDVITSSRDKW